MVISWRNGRVDHGGMGIYMMEEWVYTECRNGCVHYGVIMCA